MTAHPGSPGAGGRHDGGAAGHGERPDAVPPAAARAHAAVSHRPGPLRDLARARPRRARRRRCGSRLHRARVPSLSRMRHPRPRFRAGPLWAVRARLPHRLLLQGARRVPVVQHATHGRDRRPSRRACHSASAGAPVGALGAEATTLLPAPRPRPPGCGAAPVPGRGGAVPAGAQCGRGSCGAPRGGGVHPPLRLRAQSPPAFSLRGARRRVRVHADRGRRLPRGHWARCAGRSHPTRRH
jgi:hypothetical protein